MNTYKKVAVVLFTLFLIALTMRTCSAKDFTADERLFITVVEEGLLPKIGDNIELLSTFPVDVLVQFRIDPEGGRKAGAQRMLKLKGNGIEILDYQENISVMPMRIHNRNAMLRLLRDSDVVYVSPNAELAGAMTQALPLVDVGYIHEQIDGKGEGITIAVVGTGIRTYEPSCSKSGGNYIPSSTRTEVSYAVVTKWNFGDDVQYGCWTSDDQHETIVAEIALAVAPKAKLADYRIGGDVGGMTTVRMAQAVSKLIAEKDLYNIRVANFSISGTTKYTQDCYTAFSNLMLDLKEADILPVVSTGNNSWKDGLPEPACSPVTLSVTAIYDDDTSSIPYWANTSSSTRLAAPGCRIYTHTSQKRTFNSSGTNERYQCGTSLAAPFASGAAAALMGMKGYEFYTPGIRALLTIASFSIATDPSAVASQRRTYPILDVSLAYKAVQGWMPESKAEPIAATNPIKYIKYGTVPPPSCGELNGACTM